MADAPKVITAAEFDEMTPDERAACVAEGLVTNWDDVPADFRDRLVATAKRLVAERGISATQ
ncbi:MAG: hypothetical protein ACR2LQ_06935 [Acidimicrobiales bacterium]